MKKLLKIINEYIKTMKWEDVALLKICLFSLGLLCGIFMRRSDNKAVKAAAGVSFAVSYVVIMKDFITFLVSSFRQDKEEAEIFMDYIPE